MSFEEIFKRLLNFEYTLVHTKDNMQPRLLCRETNDLHDVPEGYIEYDRKHYRKIL
jgi:hypothetical protein